MSRILATSRNGQGTLRFLGVEKGMASRPLTSGSVEKRVIDVKVLRKRALFALNCTRVVAPIVDAAFRPGSRGLLFFCALGAPVVSVSLISGASGTISMSGSPKALINSETFLKRWDGSFAIAFKMACSIRLGRDGFNFVGAIRVLVL